MVEFDLKIHEQGTIYIPKRIRKALGSEIKATSNRAILLLYPKKMSIKTIVKSITIIKDDLELEVELEGKESER